MDSSPNLGLRDGPGPRIRLWADLNHEHDIMSTRLLGFWLYMLGDSLIFAALFAAYLVLSYPVAFNGGPTPHDVASPLRGYIETVALFSSVLAYGMVMVKLKQDRERAAIGFLLVSFLLAATFIGLEVSDLWGLAAAGAPPQRSGFLSIFWTVIVVHGIHVLVGMLWMLVMVAQIARSGFTLLVTYRMANLKIFWVYQGLVWTFLYTFVYLKGSI